MAEEQIKEQENQFESKFKRLTVEQIKYGLKRCRDEDKFPPNSLSRIIFLSYDLIDMAKAYYMVLDGNLSNKIIELATKNAKFFGLWMDEKKRKEAFEWSYINLCDRVMAGENVFINAKFTPLERDSLNICENIDKRTDEIFSSNNEALNNAYKRNINYYIMMKRIYGELFVTKSLQIKDELEKQNPQSLTEFVKCCADIAKNIDKFKIVNQLIEGKL